MRSALTALACAISVTATGFAHAQQPPRAGQSLGDRLKDPNNFLVIRTGSTLPLQSRLTVKFGIVQPIRSDSMHPLADNPSPRDKGLKVATETQTIPLHLKSTGFVYGVQVSDKEASRYDAKREEGALRFAKKVFDGQAARAGSRPLPEDQRQWTPEDRARVDRLLTSGYFNWRTMARPVDGIVLRYEVTPAGGSKGQHFRAEVALNTSGSLMMYNFDPGDEPGERVLDVYADGVLLKSIRFKIVAPRSDDRTPLPFAHCVSLLQDQKALRACRPKI